MSIKNVQVHFHKKCKTSFLYQAKVYKSIFTSSKIVTIHFHHSWPSVCRLRKVYIEKLDIRAPPNKQKWTSLFLHPAKVYKSILLEEIVTTLLSSNVSTLVSAVSLCLKPGRVNQRTVGSEPFLLELYSMLFSICQINKFMRLPEWATWGAKWWSMSCVACLHQHYCPIWEEYFSPTIY